MRDDRKEGKADFRDLVICYIIGFQNDKYWEKESEGYQALQDLLEMIHERHGGLYQEYKG